MTTISLTSIPPRFDQLGGVLESLLDQSIAATVMLQIPQSYARFPSPVMLPALPEGVVVHRTARDYGPATKLIGALEAGTRGEVMICLVKCLYQLVSAENLVDVLRPRTAVSALPYPVLLLC